MLFCQDRKEMTEISLKPGAPPGLIWEPEHGGHLVEPVYDAQHMCSVENKMTLS